MTHDKEFFAAMACDGPVTWDADIKALFTAKDIACMKPHGIDLSSYQDVMINAVQIYGKVSTGAMPLGGPPWSADWVTKFGCWIQQGTPES